MKPKKKLTERETQKHRSSLMRYSGSSVRRVRLRGTATMAELSVWNLFIRARSTFLERHSPTTTTLGRHNSMTSGVPLAAAGTRSTASRAMQLAALGLHTCVQKNKLRQVFPRCPCQHAKLSRRM